MAEAKHRTYTVPRWGRTSSVSRSTGASSVTTPADIRRSAASLYVALRSLTAAKVLIANYEYDDLQALLESPPPHDRL